MTGKTFIVGAGLGLAFALSMSAPSHASERQADLTNLVKSLNGSETYLGTIRSTDGGCFSNKTNKGLPDGGPITDAGSAAFTIPMGASTLTQCCLDVRVSSGGDGGVMPGEYALRLSGQVGASGYCVGEKYRRLLGRGQNVISMCPMDGGTTQGCNVFRLE